MKQTNCSNVCRVIYIFVLLRMYAPTKCFTQSSSFNQRILCIVVQLRRPLLNCEKFGRDDRFFPPEFLHWWEIIGDFRRSNFGKQNGTDLRKDRFLVYPTKRFTIRKPQNSQNSGRVGGRESESVVKLEAPLANNFFWNFKIRGLAVLNCIKKTSIWGFGVSKVVKCVGRGFVDFPNNIVFRAIFNRSTKLQYRTRPILYYKLLFSYTDFPLVCWIFGRVFTS